jgi:hypothetical protein
MKKITLGHQSRQPMGPERVLFPYDLEKKFGVKGTFRCKRRSATSAANRISLLGRFREGREATVSAPVPKSRVNAPATR